MTNDEDRMTMARVRAGYVVLALAMAAPWARGAEVDFQRLVREAPAYAVGEDAQVRELCERLAREVGRIVEAGQHLSPLVLTRGIAGRAALFGNPADTVDVLCDAMPLLPEDLRAKATAHAKILVSKYPPWVVGWEASGPRRELWPIPDDLVPQNPGSGVGPTPGNLYILWRYASATGDWQTIEANWPAISRFRDTFASAPQFAPRARAPRASKWTCPPSRQFSFNLPGVAGIVPGSVELKFESAKPPTTVVLKDDGQGKLTSDSGAGGAINYRDGMISGTLSADFPTGEGATFTPTLQARGLRTYDRVAGLIGYARMAGHLKKPEAAEAFESAAAALREVSEIGYAGMYKMAWAQFVSGHSHDWQYAIFHSRRVNVNNTYLTTTLFCPEIGRLLRETEGQTVRSHMYGYIEGANARAWFLHFGDQPNDSVNTSWGRPVPGGEGTGGENSMMPPDFGWTFFMLHAWVLREDASRLRQWIDIPWAKTGDLYYIQRILATIRAGATQIWAVP
jgi:hypothetical protein